MARTSRRQSKTRRKFYRKPGSIKSRKSRKSRPRKRTVRNKYIKQDRILTKLSEVLKYPGDYINKPIAFHLHKKTLDPINSAEISALGAHIGLDASEM